ncbi:hypothetical protein [Adhaeribacter pallidiroseus]|uniref:Uncharacterized protein n=1 Tax=Adhaeribacter pallidiroseus TaxID=2072847 RepID=A0A369QBI6_9BACT|nr:hypothetical protein [Adhaeribacter pallidiroseus]RDC62283.1 hypothetical protein AHMF7616_00875 [Adhaeribacter pallidiroseus]
MRNTKNQLNEKSVYNHILKEWQISEELSRLKKLPLKKLGVSVLEINWLLNTMEGEYQCHITDNNVSLSMPLENFVQIIMQANMK